MADRPILFSGPMVRALLDGRKTQMRRVLSDGNVYEDISSEALEDLEFQGWEAICAARYNFAPGDRLWVREAWHAARSLDSAPPRDIPQDADIEYAATARGYAEIGLKGKLRPGRFMPRWASRLTLIVTDVRVQRLQDISEEEAIAEGVRRIGSEMPWATSLREGPNFYTVDCGDGSLNAPTAAGTFQMLWDHLNAERGLGLDTNPWAVAITFDVIRQNIGQIADAT